MTCIITGTAGLPDGSLYRSATFKFFRSPQSVQVQEARVVSPVPVIVQSDASGAVSFALLTGEYTAVDMATKRTFVFTVPDVASIEWTACVNPVTPLPDTPTFAAGQLTGTLQSPQVPAFIGEVTSVGGSLALTIAVDAVTNAKLANVATATIKGRASAGTGDIEDLTPAQVRAVAQRQDFATRAELVTWDATATKTVGMVMRANGLPYRYTGSGTAISDLAGWVPDGEAVDDHFNGNLSALRTYLDGLSNTEHGVVRGTLTHSTPILSDADRSASLSGTTRMSNLIEPGAITEYTGIGISKTITAASNASPAVFTAAAHGLTNGTRVHARAAMGGTWAAAINGGPWLIAGATTNTFSLTTDTGTALDGTTLGAFTSAIIRSEDAISGWTLLGSFMQDYSGLVMRATQPVESIVWIGAEDYITTSGTEADFSGSLTRFSGVQFAPKTNDVTVSSVMVQNHKFTGFDYCWFIRGATGSPGLKLGVSRDQSPRTLVNGAAVHTSIKNSFIFANVVMENVELLSIENTQFDSTSFPVGLFYSGDGIASEVSIHTCSFINDGGATGSGLAAINQPPTDMTSPTLDFTSGWFIGGDMFRDWPISIKLEGGWVNITHNNFRGRNAGDIGVVIGTDVVAENIDHTNNFLQMLVNSNQGLRDDRYLTVTIIGATQANPVVITCGAGHHFKNGDRVRITSAVGMTQINSKEFIVQGKTSTTFQLYSVTDNGATSLPIDGTAFGAYTSGGLIVRPYHWHRMTVGSYTYSVGHGAFVFDLALDQLATLATGSNIILEMLNVPITGGFYEVSYGSTIDMIAVTGAVKFSVSIGSFGSSPELFSAFEHTGAANTEVCHSFSRTIYIPGQTNNNGATLRLLIDSPGVIRARGKASGTLGQTFMQIRKVS